MSSWVADWSRSIADWASSGSAMWRAIDRRADRLHDRGAGAVPLDDQFIDVGDVELVERGECDVVDEE